MNKKFLSTLITSIAFFTAPSFAANTNSNLEVKANLKAGCKLFLPDFNFGDIALTTVPKSNAFFLKNVNVNADITCSKNAAYTIKGQFFDLIPYAMANSYTGRAWILPLYNVSERRDDEFIGFRVTFVKNGADVILGSGVENSYPSTSYTIPAIGSGVQQSYLFTGKAFIYKMLTPGNYQNTYTMTIEY